MTKAEYIKFKENKQLPFELVYEMYEDFYKPSMGRKYTPDEVKKFVLEGAPVERSNTLGFSIKVMVKPDLDILAQRVFAYFDNKFQLTTLISSKGEKIMLL